MRHHLRQLLEKRDARWKGLVAFPGFVALVFVGRAVEDGGVLGTILVTFLIGGSAVYFLRPMVVLWIGLFSSFLAYPAVLGVRPWLLYLVCGILPVIFLWVARPRPAATNDKVVVAS